MPRDPRKLRVFGLADQLVLDIYDATRSFPDDEKFGLVSQMRRSSVSIAANIVEGCGRRTTRDYLKFLTMANGSAYEVGYLCGLAGRLSLMRRPRSADLERRAGEIAAGLTALVEALERADDSDSLVVARKKRPAIRPERTKRGFEVTLEQLAGKRKR